MLIDVEFIDQIDGAVHGFWLKKYWHPQRGGSGRAMRFWKTLARKRARSAFRALQNSKKPRCLDPITGREIW